MSRFIKISSKVLSNSAKLVAFLFVLLLYVAWLIFSYEQAENFGYIKYIKDSILIIDKPIQNILVSEGLRLIFAVISIIFSFIVMVITVPLLILGFLVFLFKKVSEKAFKRKTKNTEEQDSESRES